MDSCDVSKHIVHNNIQPEINPMTWSIIHSKTSYLANDLVLSNEDNIKRLKCSFGTLSIHVNVTCNKNL